MKKIIVSILLAVILTTLCVPYFTAVAAETSGTCGYGEDHENVRWEYSNGTLTISGNGEMERIEPMAPSPWSEFYTDIKKLVVEDGVTYLSFYAFKDCVNLESVKIADSVAEIGVSAFDDTAFYKNDDNWDNGVLYINNLLIAADPALSGAYTVKNGTKRIMGRGFADCSLIESITLPESLISIGYYAFGDCTSLKSITLPDNITYIEDGMFNGCTDLTEVICSDSLTGIGESAFYETGYYNDDSNWENEILYFKNFAVDSNYDSTNTDWIIRNDTKGITTYFSSSLQKIFIPASVKNILEYAFSSCDNMTDIYYGGSESQWNNLTQGKLDLPYGAEIEVHFNADEIPATKPTYIPLQTPNITQSATDTKVSFDVSLETSYENSFVYAATYDSEGNLTGLKKTELKTDGNTTIAVDKNAGSSSVKIFVMTNLIQPLINLYTTEIN